jgi:hypothetical protein
LGSLINVTEPAYRRTALELAKKVSLDDLKSFYDGTYFGADLFVAYLQLLSGLN